MRTGHGFSVDDPGSLVNVKVVVKRSRGAGSANMPSLRGRKPSTP